jgi:hypothetical protein
MRPWHRLSLRGDHRAEDILAAVPAPEAVTALWLRDNLEFDDLGVLPAFRSLEVLWLDCPWAYGLDRLAPLPLVDLACVQTASLKGMGALRSLRRLSIDRELPEAHLTDVLPIDSPLESLSLSALNKNSGLRGLEHWTGLREFQLGGMGRTLTATDWQAVASLPKLTALRLAATTVMDQQQIAVIPELTAVETLHVYGLTGGEDLSTLADRLPGLRSLTVMVPKLLSGYDPLPRLAEQFPGVQVDLVED